MPNEIATAKVIYLIHRCNRNESIPVVIYDGEIYVRNTNSLNTYHMADIIIRRGIKYINICGEYIPRYFFFCRTIGYFPKPNTYLNISDHFSFVSKEEANTNISVMEYYQFASGTYYNGKMVKVAYQSPDTYEIKVEQTDIMHIQF